MNINVATPQQLNSITNSSTPSMQDKDVDLVVLGYLKKRGFKQAENAFKSEAKVQTVEDIAFTTELEDNVSVANYIMFYNTSETAPEKYHESYIILREWIYNSSLDMFRPEILALLYPLFVHCYLDLISRNHFDAAKDFMDRNAKDHDELHSDEIKELANVTTSDHLTSNQIAHTWRNNRYNITMSRFSFELVVSYLQEKKFMLLLSILNQYLNIKVFSGQPNVDPTEDYHPITGKSDREISHINKKEIFWSLYEDQIPKPREPIIEHTPKTDEMKTGEDDQPNKKQKKRLSNINGDCLFRTTKIKTKISYSLTKNDRASRT